MAFALPEGWKQEQSQFGVSIMAPKELGGGGWVTINEKVRNFCFGISPVKEPGTYQGRGWKDTLYRDAVAALETVLSR